MGNQVLLNAHHIAVVLTTGLIVSACVLLHYEVFSWLTRALTRMHLRIRRRRILVLIFGLLTLHVVEIWLFGLGYFFLLAAQTSSQIIGSAGGLFDLVYFSAVVYTTLGLGDLVPRGAIRFMTGMEALTGFVLITWSASFTFLEMQRFWKND
ncbi:MAG: ion channel [Burkholderiales bacterium]